MSAKLLQARRVGEQPGTCGGTVGEAYLRRQFSPSSQGVSFGSAGTSTEAAGVAQGPRAWQGWVPPGRPMGSGPGEPSGWKQHGGLEKSGGPTVHWPPSPSMLLPERADQEDCSRDTCHQTRYAGLSLPTESSQWARRKAPVCGRDSRPARSWMSCPGSQRMQPLV